MSRRPAMLPVMSRWALPAWPSKRAPVPPPPPMDSHPERSATAAASSSTADAESTIPDSTGRRDDRSRPIQINRLLPAYRAHFPYHHYHRHNHSVHHACLPDRPEHPTSFWLQWFRSHLWLSSASSTAQRIEETSRPAIEESAASQLLRHYAPPEEPAAQSRWPSFGASHALPWPPRYASRMAAPNAGTAGAKSPPGSVVILGIHGWFPTAWIVQRMLGERVGTSAKLCSMMRAAVLGHFGPQNGFDDNQPIVIHDIPFHVDGRIGDRVRHCMQWFRQQVDQAEWVRRADLVLCVTHSQGTPVTFQLVHQLMQAGYLDTKRQCIGLLCMAGITHGPFAALKSNPVIQYVETDPARELFELCHAPTAVDGDISSPAPTVVDETWRALKELLRAGVAIHAVASWLDQVVPLYSGLMSAVHHPNILRSVYIDAHNFKSDFLTDLIVYLVELRNLGVSDRQLLVYLSDAFVGSLYGGVEHSTIYKEPKVYQNALNWFCQRHPQPVGVDPRLDTLSVLPPRPNPNFVPWAFRALLADPRLHRDPYLRSGMVALLESLDAWQPTTRPGKDVRLQFEPCKSKL